MLHNIPIPELPMKEMVALAVTVTSVRQGVTKNNNPFCDAVAVNSTGKLQLKIWSQSLEEYGEIKPGLWGISGHLDRYQDQDQFVVETYKLITVDKYREFHGSNPDLPRSFTIDIETLALPGFRARVPHKLEKLTAQGKMSIEQLQRYTENRTDEEELTYQLGGLHAYSGRVISIAVHLGNIPDFAFQEINTNSEYVFGINSEGHEESESDALTGFLKLMADYRAEVDEIVGHNIIGFDLPFIFQRCLVNNLPIKPFVKLGEYKVRGVYDTMRQWWLGLKQTASLDDIAWALGIESSKTDEVEGSRVFDLYSQGKLAEIREYNLRDVRVTRKIYERMISCFGR
ncbi:MAG: ribonuclease H-like domain-containing protein [Pyrinomonadaceae bacterium]